MQHCVDQHRSFSRKGRKDKANEEEGNFAVWCCSIIQDWVKLLPNLVYFWGLLLGYRRCLHDWARLFFEMWWWLRGDEADDWGWGMKKRRGSGRCFTLDKSGQDGMRQRRQALRLVFAKRSRFFFRERSSVQKEAIRLEQFFILVSREACKCRDFQCMALRLVFR